MKRQFEVGAYQADEKENFNADKSALKSLIEAARNSDIAEDKQNKRQLVKELLAHGFVDRDFILELLKDNGYNKETLKEWETKILTTKEILDVLIPFSAEASTGKKDETLYDEIEIADEDMPTMVEIEDMILPTDDEPKLKPGITEYEPPKTIPRTNMLIKMLKEYGIESNEYIIISGRNNPDTVRQQSYKMFLLPKIDKMVFVCDEEGNATFILHQLAADTDNIKKIYSLKKSELKVMNELVDQINWTNQKEWEEQIFEAITKESPISGKIINWKEFIQTIREQIQISSRERPNLVDLETLKAEVRAAGIDTTSKYQEERNNHPGWPSTPARHYGDKWVNWYDIFGREKPPILEERKKRSSKYLDFETLKMEVRVAGISNQIEYRLEQKKHPDWPSAPYDHYKKEWTNFSDFFGREKKQFLDFQTFKAEIRAAGVKNKYQYTILQKQHSDWPYHPEKHYKDDWTDWDEVLGIKKVDFQTFIAEVKKAGITSSQNFKELQKQHPNWPLHPEREYPE